MHSTAQDLSNLAHQKPFAISGTLDVRLSAYKSNIPTPFYPSSGYTISGTPTISIYGFAIPFSFLYTNQQLPVFGQPFNQFGISPSYKHFTLHIGYRNINYSKYALADYQLFGVGTEYEKGNWKVGLCYGRLRKMALLGLDSSSGLVPYSYQRKAIAGLVKYGNEKKFIAISFLSGKDNPSSVPDEAKTKVQNYYNPTPAGNMVVDLHFKLPLFIKNLSLESESGISYYTNDITSSINQNNIQKKEIPLSGLLSNFTKLNATSHYYTALDGKLNYVNKKGLNTFLKYKKVDPNFQSMGVYYMQGDIQDILAGGSIPFLHNKIRIGGSIGRQNNNLKNTSTMSSVRWIGSGTASYSDAKFGVDMNYYNFSSDQSPTVSRYADSLRITQSTKTLNISPRYCFSTKTAFHSFNLSFGLNTALDLNNSLTDTGQIRELYTQNVGFNYSVSVTKQDLNINTGLIFTNLTDHGLYAYKSFGVNVGATKTLFAKKVNLSINGGLYKTIQLATTSVNHTASVSASYLLTKKLHTDLLLMYNDAPGVSSITNLPKGTREFRSELNFSYTF